MSSGWVPPVVSAVKEYGQVTGHVAPYTNVGEVPGHVAGCLAGLLYLGC